MAVQQHTDANCTWGSGSNHSARRDDGVHLHLGGLGWKGEALIGADGLEHGAPFAAQ
jgi:hypothetical protein